MIYRFKHLEEVNESYFEHFWHAMSFAVHMLIGAFACAVHAVLPFVFEKTGSSKINVLYDRMVVNRSNLKMQRNDGRPLVSGVKESTAE